MKLRHIEIVIDWSTAEITFETCHSFKWFYQNSKVIVTIYPVWFKVLRREILLQNHIFKKFKALKLIKYCLLKNVDEKVSVLMH